MRAGSNDNPDKRRTKDSSQYLNTHQNGLTKLSSDSDPFKGQVCYEIGLSVYTYKLQKQNKQKREAPISHATHPMPARLGLVWSDQQVRKRTGGRVQYCLVMIMGGCLVYFCNIISICLSCNLLCDVCYPRWVLSGLLSTVWHCHS